MTSNDAPVPGAGGSAGPRRALGRGPGTIPAPAEAPAPVEPVEEVPEAVAPEPEPAPEAPPADSASAGPEEAVEPGGPVELAELAEPGAAVEPAELAEPAGPVEPGAAVEPVGPVEPAGPVEPGAAVEPAEPAELAEPIEPGGPAELAEPAGPEESADGVFKVRLSNFEGPFDLLLQLISKHKLDVTEVALSKVTDEFMAHIRAMGPDWDLDETTEFLVVAATLLDLKAARLLPAAEVEDEADLALLEARDLLFARLLQYRAYKQIADIFNHRLLEEARRYPRTVGLEPHHADLLPEVVISIGAEGFAKLAVKAMQPKPKPQVYVDHIHAPLVSVQEQAGIVVARLRELGEASFRVLVEDTDDTLTVVARFLALLELYREKAVVLDQEIALGELMVRWTGGEGDETPTVTDEFDRPPEAPKEEKKP
ncbi:segregation and condensation protein A [Streptomyces fulvoviolaceus]|uniref:segregation and condensation protein A n=1 Tax=Streptomyces fulvoviolaceus TaxID=285535 RepID=UPI000D11CA03|nr:segregation/condensation protein A [Streptomyces fulvoviolaceus]